MGLAALETRLSFLDSVDDDAVSFPFLLFFFYYLVQNTYMFPIALIWLVCATFWVCNCDATTFTIVMT